MRNNAIKRKEDWTIRKARVEDVEELLSLSERVTDICSRKFLDDDVVDRYIGSEAFTREVTDNLERMHVLLDGGKLIGFCVWQDNDLKSMMTDIDYHGTGAAVYFLTEIAEALFKRYETLFLECFETNARAIAFYEKLGWEHYETAPVPELNVNSKSYRLKRIRQQDSEGYASRASGDPDALLSSR